MDKWTEILDHADKIDSFWIVNWIEKHCVYDKQERRANK